MYTFLVLIARSDYLNQGGLVNRIKYSINIKLMYTISGYQVTSISWNSKTVLNASHDLSWKRNNFLNNLFYLKTDTLVPSGTAKLAQLYNLWSLFEKLVSFLLWMSLTSEIWSRRKFFGTKSETFQVAKRFAQPTDTTATNLSDLTRRDPENIFCK